MSGGPAISPRSLVYVSSTNSILHFRTYKAEIDVEMLLALTHSYVKILLFRMKRSMTYWPVGKSGENYKQETSR